MRTPVYRRPLTAEEDSLWRQVIKDVAPLGGRRAGHAPIRSPRSLPASPRPERPADFLITKPAARPSVPSESSYQLGRGWDRKLRRGTASIDRRIDLHGLTREAAIARLHGVVLAAVAEDKRCLLVITGKGARKDREMSGDSFRATTGVLKHEVPRWLRHGPLASYILAVETAHPRDGGGGACYVILRRRRAPPVKGSVA